MNEVHEQTIGPSVFYKWGKILSYLETQLGEATVAAWLEDAVVIEFTEESLKIGVGSNFKCNIIKLRCLHHIQNALAELFHNYATVEVYPCDHDEYPSET